MIPNKNFRGYLGFIIFAALLFYVFIDIGYAHPQPEEIFTNDIDPIAQSLSILALLITLLIYLRVGLRHSNRAHTVREFFFYDKKVTPSQYFDTTVAYSFQVVVTVYFIYWGFLYGIGIFIYALMWLLGLWLFQKASPRLLAFALSNETLHSFLSVKFGTIANIRRLTALCTILGLGGALLVEVNYGTDILAFVGSKEPSNILWALLFGSLLFFTWLYTKYGGYKAAVNTDSVQLPITYGALSIVLMYLIWLAFSSSTLTTAAILGFVVTFFWLALFIVRRRTINGVRPRDLVTMISLFASLLTFLLTLVLMVRNNAGTGQTEPIADLPSSFSLQGLVSQDLMVIIGFFVLNLAWQFFDMAAWQRLTSLDISGKDKEEQKKLIRNSIGETKWESPLTWTLGILLGIALRQSGLFENGAQAGEAFFVFIGSLSHGTIEGIQGTLGSYIVLPVLIAAFIGMMMSTTDSFLSTVTYAWMHDVAKVDVEKVLDDRAENSITLKNSQKLAGVIILTLGVLFFVFTRILNWQVFLLINVFYSAQFALTLPTISALYLKEPTRIKSLILWGMVLMLIANFAAAYYCYVQMATNPEGVWASWYYVFPTVAAAAVGVVIFAIAFFKAKKFAKGEK